MFDRNSTGNHTNTLRSLFTLKEEIRARDPLFRVFIDITISHICIALFLFFYTLCTKIFLIFHKSGFVNYKLFLAMGFKVIKEMWLTMLHVVILLYDDSSL